MILLTPEQIETNRRFCNENKIEQKKPRKQGRVLRMIIDFIKENSPCSSKQINDFYKTQYIYSPKARRMLFESDEVVYNKKHQLWHKVGEELGEFPKNTIKDRLLTMIKDGDNISREELIEEFGDSAAMYLIELKNKGYIKKNVSITYNYIKP